MSAAGERQRAKARGRPCEQGEAKARRARLRARVAADHVAQRVHANGAEAARRRAIEQRPTTVRNAIDRPYGGRE